MDRFWFVLCRYCKQKIVDDTPYTGDADVVNVRRDYKMECLNRGCKAYMKKIVYHGNHFKHP